MMTIAEALAYGRLQLNTTSPTPALDARLLLEHILQKPHTWLIAHDDTPLTDEQHRQYQQMLQRAQQKEPIPYITGHAPFYGLDFLVSPAVLIPRPETEQLVEMALRWAAAHHARHIVDVGTGSGCIPIVLARHLPQAQVTAVDISQPALQIARQNALRLAPGRIHFHHGSLLEPVTQPIDLLTANLPYISDAEWTELDDGVKWFEPAIALRGGQDGLALIQQLLKQAVDKLKPVSAIFLEIGWQQGSAATRLAQSIFPNASISLIQDYAGHDRIVAVEMINN